MRTDTEPSPGTTAVEPPTERAPGWLGAAGRRSRAAVRRLLRQGRARRWRDIALWTGAALAAAWMLLRLSGWGMVYPLVQLLAFTPYVLPVAVLLTVACGLSRRWAAGVLCLAACVGLGVVVLPRASGSPDPDAGGVHLHVLSANMKVGVADADNLVRLVRERDVDVLALQEFTPDARDRLRAAGLESLLPNTSNFPDLGVGGSAVYSRYPLTGIGYRPLPAGFGQAFAVLHLPDAGTVRVESAHPCSPALRRWTSAWHTGLALEPRADPGGGPQLLLGDFNATLDHQPMRELVASGYTDVAVHLGDGLTPTWPFDGRPVPPVTIDHVLVVGLRAYHFATFANPGSDHRAVYAEIGLPAR